MESISYEINVNVEQNVNQGRITFPGILLLRYIW